ncbi:uncharacterized protein PV09_01605 [Verruconis gallopava]|uniref:Uncharacterized protein n=1 Tax=Verruconis gallopava TaxID=253628 RepID=A0A0D2AMG7_9PEZI|nr:uncharacterized protein PV09_01605 [Verruconis gallopava]KIW07665.1 hypothetical protein PV09_01605 [Verruconis gallopava]
MTAKVDKSMPAMDDILIVRAPSPSLDKLQPLISLQESFNKWPVSPRVQHWVYSWVESTPGVLVQWLHDPDTEAQIGMRDEAPSKDGGDPFEGRLSGSLFSSVLPEVNTHAAESMPIPSSPGIK